MPRRAALSEVGEGAAANGLEEGAVSHTTVVLTVAASTMAVFAFGCPTGKIHLAAVRKVVPSRMGKFPFAFTLQLDKSEDHDLCLACQDNEVRHPSAASHMQIPHVHPSDAPPACRPRPQADAEQLRCPDCRARLARDG